MEMYNFTLTPRPDNEVLFRRGGDNRVYLTYDVKEHTKGSNSFNLAANYNRRVKYIEITPPPLYAQRYVTGYGLEKGGITCIIHNMLDTELTLIYMETMPWYLRLYFNSIKIEANGIRIKPYQTHYTPGKDRSRPYQLELVFRVRPQSVNTISMEFDRAFLKWTEYPPDANHGFYVNSAVISTMLPVGDQYTSPPQNSSTFGDSMTDKSSKFFLRLHTESLLVSLPTPDFSMPYNVICLACTVVAIAFGSIHNLTTRTFVAIDPKNKPSVVEKLKLKIGKIFKKKSANSESDKTSEKENEEMPDEKELLKSEVKT